MSQLSNVYIALELLFRKCVTLGVLRFRRFCHAQADEFEAWRTGSDFQPDRGSSFRDSPAKLFEQLLRLAAVVGVGAPYADQIRVAQARADQKTRDEYTFFLHMFGIYFKFGSVEEQFQTVPCLKNSFKQFHSQN